MQKVSKSVVFLSRLREKTSAKLLGRERNEQAELEAEEQHRRERIEFIAKVCLVVVYGLIAVILLTMGAHKLGNPCETISSPLPANRHQSHPEAAQLSASHDHHHKHDSVDSVQLFEPEDMSTTAAGVFTPETHAMAEEVDTFMHDTRPKKPASLHKAQERRAARHFPPFHHGEGGVKWGAVMIGH